MNQGSSKLLVFAHVPPPEHGQSRMIATMLEALDEGVIHVDARYSDEMSDVGSGRFGKLFLVLDYLRQAMVARWRGGARTLYYVPGPATWPAVLRDWAVLAVLRPWYRDLVLHWHAIGQGEWAHGGTRVRLPGPRLLDRAARRVSALLLRQPTLSISVSPCSGEDARAVSSGRVETVCNGIDDPCPGFEQEQAPVRRTRSEYLRTTENPELRVLFLSHGTVAKGLVDALEALEGVAKRMSGQCRLSVTFAGGVAPDLEPRFRSEVDRINADEGLAMRARTCGFIMGEDKKQCFVEADLFLAPSRWESFGLTVAEAMAWGLPVVAAASDGVRGVLSDEYDWFAPPGDVDRLAEVLERGVQNVLSGCGDAWGRGLRARFEQQFGSDHFRTGIKRVLETHCTRAGGSD